MTVLEIRNITEVVEQSHLNGASKLSSDLME